MAATVSRAAQFGRRFSKIQGGTSLPIYLVAVTNAGVDYSRGVDGVITKTETELIPRPTLRVVKADYVTNDGIRLKEGDLEFDIVSSLLTTQILESEETRLRLGAESENGTLLDIFDYTSPEYLNDKVYFRVYARGVSGP